MELLDAAIALVITLAALATTVTVLMEIWIRIFGLKSKTQVELFQRIFTHAVDGKFDGSPDQDSFVSSVLLNPLLRDRNNGSIRKPGKGEIAPFFGFRSRGIYEWVSDEHVYRRLLSMPGVAAGAKQDLVARLQTFSRSYDELCAAASVEFKEDRRLWSIIGGVLLAIAFNVDGIRIFNEYLKRPELAAAITARADELEKTAREAQARLDAVVENPGEGDVGDIERRVEELKDGLAGLESAGIPIGWGYPPHCLFLNAPVKETSGEAPIDANPPSAKPTDTKPPVAGQTGAEPGAAAPPAGQPTAATPRDACGDDVKGWNPWLVGLSALIPIIGTGILIGLGAPFWFDVARRLAEVRSFFGGSGGGEAAYNGETAGKPDKQKSKTDKTNELIDRVVDEVLTDGAVRGVRRLLVERSET